MTRIQIINHLIQKYGFTDYLELGIHHGECFTQIQCQNKTGVDPDPAASHATHCVTSDAFFAGLEATESFDLIFIDGSHLDEQVDKDIENALLHLREGGFVVLHDCNPPDLEHAGETEPQVCEAWNGTVYRSVIKLRLTRADLMLQTVNTDWGVGILRRGTSELLQAEPEEALTWNYFDSHRREILQLITPPHFLAAYSPRSAADKPNPIRNYYDIQRAALNDKWDHYFDIYEAHGRRFVGQSPRVLEIGEGLAGSLQMWRNYFGPGTRMVGLDYGSMGIPYNDETTTLLMTNQMDRNAALKKLQQLGPFDIILDVACHLMHQTGISFQDLLAMVQPRGLLLVEDCHRSYFTEYGGGRQKAGNFIEFAKGLVDELNAWHQRDDAAPTANTESICSVTFYDAVVVIEKKPRTRPRSQKTRVEIPTESAKLAALNSTLKDAGSPFVVKERTMTYGELNCGDQLGYHDLAVTNFLKCRWLLSAHAESRVVVEVTAPVDIVGFMNGTAMYSPGAEFLVDGESLGTTRAAMDFTRHITLTPGKHVLEVKREGGEALYHSVWGFAPDPALLVEPRYELTVGTICQDDNASVVEWVRHHLAAGVDHIYLLDDGSQIPLARTILEAGLSENVTVENFHAECDVRLSAYDYLTTKYAAECRWLALIDVCEFLIPKLSNSLKKILSAFGEYGCVELPRVMFGPVESDGIQGCYYDLHSCQQILQPRFMHTDATTGESAMMVGRRTVNEHFSSFTSEPTAQRIQLNHYWTKPRSPWFERMEREMVDPERADEVVDFAAHAARCLYRDESMEKYRAAMKAPISVLEHPPIVGFIHVAAVNHWRALLESQLMKCHRSGLLERSAQIKLGVVGAGPEIKSQLDWLPKKVSVEICNPNLLLYEFPSLELLQQEAEGEQQKYLWYIHSKGVTSLQEIAQGWRARMEEFVLVHQEVAVQKLAEGHIVAAGFGVPDPRVHVPGNFFWIRSEHAARLPKIASLDHTNRWDAEWWVGKFGSRGFYLHDYGTKVCEDFEILESQTGASLLSTCGYHSWNSMPVLVGKHFPRLDHCFSAHAPSTVLVNLKRPAQVVGFMSASGRPAGWIVDFLVDGKHLVTHDTCNLPSAAVVLEPGEHQLDVVLRHGEKADAHSVWGLAF